MDNIEEHSQQDNERAAQQQVEQELGKDRVSLEEQIEHIKLIEQKINHLIYDLEAANQHLNTLIQNEKDPNKKKGYYSAISYNVEKLTKLYSVLREYQDTKYKYLSTISDMSYKKNRLVHLELAKIQEGAQHENYVLFNRLINAMGGQNNLSQDAIEEIDDDEDYKV